MQVHDPYSVPIATDWQGAFAHEAGATVRRMNFRIPDDVNEQRIRLLQEVLDGVFAGNKAELGRRLGYKDGSFVGQLLRGDKAFNEPTLLKLLNLPETRRVTRESITPKMRGLDHVLSDFQPIVNIQMLSWEALVSSQIPEQFFLTMLDDSMAPLMEMGDMGKFSKSATPRPGRPVLCRDAAKALYVREYRPKRPDLWRAVPLNPAYIELDSEADKLTVLAVMTGLEWR